MRQIFCNKYSFYKFLEDLNTLPDSCSSIPYFDSDFTEYNIFYVFTKFEPQGSDDEITFRCSVNKKQLNHRISFNRTEVLYQFTMKESEFYPLLFVSSLIKMSDFISYLCQINKDLSDILDTQWSNQSRV